MIANIRHVAILAFAGFCLIVGLATVWLPIPTGIPLLAFGVFLVIANSRIGRNAIRKMRKHVPLLDHAVSWVEERAGKTMGRVLKTTRPLVTRTRKKAETLAKAHEHRHRAHSKASLPSDKKAGS